MDTRRDFIKKAGLLSGLMGMNSLIPAAVQKALAIDAIPGSSWKDAEHVVILMQENRSFDHTYGTLKGVRGFNDPRIIQQANNNPVWLQSNEAGETYAPFRLDLKNSKATWMSSLPHNWKNQVNARNDGKHDQWLNVKRNSNEAYADMPLTLGYYTREDIPFYYALADGFTVCDQNFCSALTGTDPNRLFFWTGTVRSQQNENSRALVWNDDVDYETLNWKTFPELLEEHGIDWKFYQNEVSIEVGFKGEQAPWLSNFQDNPLEFFSQYHIKLHGKHTAYLKTVLDTYPKIIATQQSELANRQPTDPGAADLEKSLAENKRILQDAMRDIENYNPQEFISLSDKAKNLHENAFVTNVGDPDYHTLESIVYSDQGTEREMLVPKGDLLYQFRQDVQKNKLPMVSWIAAPEHLSDHPSSAWYGAWYVSEVMDILTQNPEIWKKTIFILAYDENDGYFDHVPPFTAPHSDHSGTGMVSKGIDTKVEYVTQKQEEERKGFPEPFDRESSIGLGFRVPLVIASPWTKGGFVNSEVFDHTSTLRFLETFLSQKTGKKIRETNISTWRRTVCGDLTSVFRTDADNQPPGLDYVVKQPFLELVYNAQFKPPPADFKLLTAEEIAVFQIDPYASDLMPKQESGVKPSCGLHYELYANGQLTPSKDAFVIRLAAGNQIFGEASLGSPFNVYAPGREIKTWAFAVKASDYLEPVWSLSDFENGLYHLQVFGPNGFYRSFIGNQNDPMIDIDCLYEPSATNKNKLTGNLLFHVTNNTNIPQEIVITDNAYQSEIVKKTLQKSGSLQAMDNLILNLSKQFGWYDFTVRVTGEENYEKRFAGRVETGQSSFSDPFMGRTVKTG
jgi:phospholipase C